MLKIEIIKNFYYLADILIDNGYDKTRRLSLELAILYEKSMLHNTMNEDLNILMIVL